MIKTHNISPPKSYSNLLSQTLLAVEGNTGLPYYDNATPHLPTVGIGYNLKIPAVRSEVLTALHIDPRNPAQKPYVNNIIKILNGPILSNSKLRTALNAQMAKLHKIDRDIPATFKLTASASLAILPDVILALRVESKLNTLLGNGNVSPSLERVALASLFYNAPTLIGPKLIAAIKGGNHAEAWFEIRYGSNATNDKGLVKRRLLESDLFGLYDPGAVAQANPTAAFTNQMAVQTFTMVVQHINSLFLPKGSALINPDTLVTAAKSDYSAVAKMAKTTDANFQIRTLGEELAPSATYLLTNAAAASSGNVLVFNQPGNAINNIDLRSLGGAALAVFVQQGSFGPQLVLNDGHDVVYSNTSQFIFMGNGTYHMTLNGSGYTISEASQPGSGADDTITLWGHSIANTFTGTGAMDAFGRTYNLTGTALNISSASGNLSIGGFHNGDFGITFQNVSQQALLLTQAMAQTTNTGAAALSNLGTPHMPQDHAFLAASAA